VLIRLDDDSEVLDRARERRMTNKKRYRVRVRSNHHLLGVNTSKIEAQIADAFGSDRDIEVRVGRRT
jgi:hypothetical protein